MDGRRLTVPRRVRLPPIVREDKDLYGEPSCNGRTRAGAALLLVASVLSGRVAVAQTDAPPAGPVAAALGGASGAQPPPAVDSVPSPPAIESFPPLPPTTPPEGPAIPANVAAPAPVEAPCASCGGAGTLPPGPGGILTGCTSCGGTGCVPGRKPSQGFHYHTVLGRFFGNLYECLCCPDPCYEPSWIPEANAGFFVDWARPRTIQRVRYEHVNDFMFPDRSEFFWARENVGKGGGKGPGAPKGFKNFHGERSLNYDQLSLYQEAATERASFFFEIPYTAINPSIVGRSSGFSIMNIGTKALFYDCELIQLAFQFRTYFPIGNTSEGLGNGHVSLEPSLLMTLRLAPETYLQGQLAEWIPIGGDPVYQGSILHSAFSLNHVLLRFAPEMPLIGTFEMNGWSFQNGSYTDPSFPKSPARYGGGETYFSLGPGLRTSICNKVDFGAAALFPLTDPSMGTMVRVEIRVLY